MWFSSQCSRGGLWWGTFTTYSCFFLFVLKHLAEYFCNCTTHTLNRGWLACKGIIKSFFEVPAYTKNTYLPYFNLSKYRILKEKNRRWLTLQKRDLQVYSLIGLICLLGFGNITTFQHQITTPLNFLFFFPLRRMTLEWFYIFCYVRASAVLCSKEFLYYTHMRTPCVGVKDHISLNFWLKTGYWKLRSK